MLKEEYGLSIVATSGSMSLLNIAGVISNPLGGIIADKVGEKKVLLYGFFFLMVSTLLFSLGYGSPILLPLVFLIGWFINFTRSPSFSIVPELFGVRNAGSISGINNTFASLGALILPFLLGYVRDISNSYTIGWYSVATLSLLTVSLLYFIENPENV